MNQEWIYKHIGGVIKSRRNNLDLTQEQLSGQLGISRASLANIETGRQNFPVHQLYALALALKMTPADLLPQPSDELTKTSSSILPLPKDLKPKQKEEITRLLEGVQTDQAHQEGVGNVKKKRT